MISDDDMNFNILIYKDEGEYTHINHWLFGIMCLFIKTD